ncbi:MAG: pentapeptide repeat-containing protein, partial [Desulfobacteraceae bacterium]
MQRFQTKGGITMDNPTHITTFYSYKGGVGRTMLLANTGALLARMGRKVLLWDLDVEAPGMHVIPALTPDPAHERGFLEWLKDVQDKRPDIAPTPEDLDDLSGLIRMASNIRNLDILPAFGDKADSAGLYQDIPWHRFLVEKPGQGLDLFRTILNHFSDTGKYDHILLDSRTGITDLGGLMTAILPHAVVLVGSYGSQNLSGLLQIDRALCPAMNGKYAVQRAPLPDLKRLLVASPVPGDQEKRLTARREVWDKEFPALSGDTVMETRVEIPFDSRLLFREDLLAMDDQDSEIAKAYTKIAESIDSMREDLMALSEAEERGNAVYPDMVQSPGRVNRSEKGKTFEDKVAKLLTLLGYRVESEQILDGNRVDLVARQTSGLREECYLVECKDHQKPVAKNVIETLGVWLDGTQAKNMRAEGMVVARAFSPAALTFAKARGILAFTPEELERRLFDFGPYLASLRQAFETSDLARTYVNQRVLLERNPDSQGADLIDHAVTWAKGEGSRLWLLLGDYGTGKTAFFKRFVYELAKHEGEPGMLIPMAVDLKEFPNAISLEGLIQEHLRASVNWNGNPDILLHLLSSGRVILLLDAFDEMGTAAVGRSVEEQFRQLLKPIAASGDKKGNRILITCRTHFFKDQQNVKDVLHGSSDDLVSHDSELGKLARAFDGTIDELLLFNDSQIREFLNLRLSAVQAKQAETFIRETYDLPSLAPRPVLLEMIVNSLPDLMASKTGVTPAGLYHKYTTRWLTDKSGGNLQTSPQLRKKILETLAFDIWGRSLHRVHHRELVAVLDKMEPGILNGIDRDRVDLELRTAAFLIRNREGYYTFSHKSFREFFYARHLLSSVKQGAGKLADALFTAPITPECTAFFCDLAEYGQNDQAGQNGCGFDAVKTEVRGILAAPYRPRTSENALVLAYHCAAYTLKKPENTGNLADSMRPFMPDSPQLQGAVLKEINLKGAWLEMAEFSGADLEQSDLSKIRASGAVFSRANLAGAKLENADCRNGVFTGAAMREVNAKQADFTGAVFENANLTAAVFVKTKCSGATFRKSNCYGARFAQAVLENTEWSDAVTQTATAPDTMTLPPGVPDLPPVLVPILQTGHSGAVTSAVFSSNGEQVLTASYDKTAALWDLATGKLIHRFKGHDSRVTSAVFSSDGGQVLTASSDKTAALWDLATGKLIRRFKGHDSGVTSAVFSSDGGQVLTASADKTAALWDL